MLYNYGLIHEYLTFLTPTNNNIAIYYGPIFWNNESFYKPSCETLYNLLRKPKWEIKNNVAINWIDYKSFKIRLDNLESLPNYLIYDKQGYFLVIYEYLNDTKSSIIFLAINDIWLNQVLRVNTFHAQKILTNTSNEIEIAQNYNNALSFNQYTSIIKTSRTNKKIKISWKDPFYQYDYNYNWSNFLVNTFKVVGTEVVSYVNDNLDTAARNWNTTDRVSLYARYDFKINTKQLEYFSEIDLNTNIKYKTRLLIDNKPLFIIGIDPLPNIKVDKKTYLNDVALISHIDLDNYIIYDLNAKTPLKTLQNEIKRIPNSKEKHTHLLTKLTAHTLMNVAGSKILTTYLNIAGIKQLHFEMFFDLNKRYKKTIGPRNIHHKNNSEINQNYEKEIKNELVDWIQSFDFNELVNSYNTEKIKAEINYNTTLTKDDNIIQKYNKPNNGDWYVKINDQLYLLHYQTNFYFATTNQTQTEINTNKEITLTPTLDKIYEIVLANNTRVKVSGLTTINYNFSSVLTPTKNKVIYEVNINTPTKTYKELLTFENNILINEQNKLNTDLKLLNESLTIKESIFNLSQKQTQFNSAFGFGSLLTSTITAPFTGPYGAATAIAGVSSVSKSLGDLIFLNQHLENNKKQYDLERKQAVNNYLNSLNQIQSLVNITDWETTLKHYNISDFTPFIIYELKENKFDIIINEELKENIGIPCKISDQWQINNLTGINQFFNPIVEVSHYKHDITNILVNPFKII